MIEIETIIEKLKALPVDVNGHNEFLTTKCSTNVWILYDKPEIKDIILNQTDGEYITKPSCLDACSICGKDTQMIITKDGIKIADPCEYPDGLPPCKVQINVPSGKLVFGNDFRKFVSANPDFYLNYEIDLLKTSKAYAEDGLFHGFTGNSMPGIFKTDGELKIVSPAYDEETDESVPFDGEKLGSICTDLWWFSAMDYDAYISKGGEVGDWETVVEVEPGQYESEMILEYKDWKEENVYAIIKKVE